jgi:GT2 family glycosyltransferase
LSKIGIVTVVRNEKNNLTDFYYSLLHQTFKGFILYLVDNNSTDGSIQLFSELNKNGGIHTSFIRLDYNSGFAGGSNIGAKNAIKDGCEYLFILNNDVLINEKCLRELVELTGLKKEIAAAGLLLFRHNKKYPDVIQEYGGKINFKKGVLKKYYENSNIKDEQLPVILETDFIGGGMCFIKADVFEKVGMFEESYFAYFDEIDLSYRLKVINNYRMCVTSERNKFLYFRKYKLHASTIYTLFADLLRFPWRLFWFVKVCDFNLGIYYLRGMKDGLFGKTGKPYFL